MRWLLLDCGNSRIKWQFASGQKLIGSAQAESLGPESNALERLSKAVSSKSPDRVIVANVAGPDIEQAIVDWAKAHELSIEFAAVSSEACGVRCGYDHPDKLGVDRWLALIAAYAKVQGAVCLVSAGTAVTIDVLDGGGRHRGGLILVGATLAAQVLEHNTAGIGPTKLPKMPVKPAGIGGILGRNTESAVAHGVLLATAAAVDRTVKMAVADLGQTLRLLLTGGDAERVMPWLEHPALVEPDLVLKGLFHLAAAGDLNRNGDG
jgi:type III pantothenate kinase